MRLVLCLLAISIIAGLRGNDAIAQEHSALIAGVPNEIHRVGEFGVSIENSRLRDALGSTPAIVDAFSYGRDFGHHKIGHAFFLWSVSSPAGSKKQSLPKSPHYREPPAETAADLFWAHDRKRTSRSEFGAHGKAADENNASPVPVDFPGNQFLRIARTLGLGGLYGEPGGSDDVVGFDPWPPGSTMEEDDLFFSIDRTITISCTGTPITFGPGDILLLPGDATPDPCNIIVSHAAADLGLGVGDDIDALSVNRLGLAVVGGALVTAVEPTGWYSLKPGSPSLASDFTSGDIFQYELGVVYGDLADQIHLPCGQLGLCLTDVGTDVDAVGHIDPEGVQIPSHCPLDLLLPDGSVIDGFVGLSALPGQPLELGKEFLEFEGSFAVAVDQQLPPGGALPGTAGVGQFGVVPPDPGSISIVEFAGATLTRDLVDHASLIFPPDAGAPQPVTGLAANVDPVAQTITWVWNPSPGSIGTEVRVNGGPPQLASPPFVLPVFDPGEFILDARAIAATPLGDARSEARYEVAFFSGTLAPPHAVELVPGAMAPFDLVWQNPNPLGYSELEITLDGQLLQTVPAQNNSFPLILPPGLHFIAVRGIGAQGSTAAIALRVFVPIEAPPQLPPTGHVSFSPSGLPITLAGNPAAGTPAVTAVSIDVPAGSGIVTDAEAIVRLSHPRLEGVRVEITSPAGTTISLIEPLGVTGTVIDRHLDDVGDPSTADNAGDVRTDGAITGLGLSAFDGELADGPWQVAVQNSAAEVGTLEQFEWLLLLGSAQFRRSDANNDGGIDIGDAIYLLGVLFPGGGPGITLACADAGDANDDGLIDIGDPIALLGVLFSGSTNPTPGAACGADPTADSLDCQASACP